MIPFRVVAAGDRSHGTFFLAIWASRTPSGHTVRSSGTCPGRSSGTCPGRSSGTCPGRSSGTCPGRSSGTCPGRSSGTLSGHAFGGFRAPWTALKVPENRTVRPLSWQDSTLFLARQRPGRRGENFHGTNVPSCQRSDGRRVPDFHGTNGLAPRGLTALTCRRRGGVAFVYDRRWTALTRRQVSAASPLYLHGTTFVSCASAPGGRPGVETCMLRVGRQGVPGWR